MKNKLLAIGFILILLILAGCGVNNQYLVTYDLGYDDKRTVVSVEGSQVLEKPDEPSRDGYLFNGWFRNLEDEKPYEFNEPLTSNITLYAKWRDAVNNVSVTFTNGDGYTYENQVIPENSKSIKPNNPIKLDYDFMYWSLDGVKFDFETIVTTNIVLVAVFEASFKEEYRNELISKIDDFNNKLIDTDYQIEFDLKNQHERYINTFQYQHDETSLITVDRGYGFIDYFLLEPKENDVDYLLAETYNGENNSNLHLFRYNDEIKRINIFELNMLKDDFKVKKVNDTYIINVTWEELLIENHALFNYDLKHYFFANLNNIRRDDIVTFEFKLDETFEISISVLNYIIKSTYYLELEPLLLDLDLTLQLGETTYQNAVFPVKENMWHYERVANYEKQTYYFLFDLEPGYYEINHASEAYEFLDLEGNVIELETIYAFNNINSKYHFLINITTPTKFYMGLKTKVSLARYVTDTEQVGIVYSKYDYQDNELLISDGNNIELTNISGGDFDPFIIEVEGDFDAYEITTSGYINGLNFTGGSIIGSNGTKITYFYKKADMDRYLIYVTGDDVSLKINPITMQGEVKTSAADPYVLTTEESPLFYTALAYNDNHFSLVVSEAGVYQVEALFEGEVNYYLWVGGKSLEPGEARFLNVGTYRVTIESTYYKSFSIRYHFREDVEVDVSLGEEVTSKVYALTKISYQFNNLVDSAVNLEISHDYPYDLEFEITTPEGITHAYFKDEIPNLYFKAGTYVINTKVGSVDYDITFKATSLDVPDHTNYSYEYQMMEFGKTYQITNSIFGHFYDIDYTYNNDFFIFKGNIKFYEITSYSINELRLSTDFSKYIYNEAMNIYIKAGVSGTITVTIGSHS